MMQSLSENSPPPTSPLPRGQKASAEAKADVTPQTADPEDPYAAEKLQILNQLNAQ